MRPPCTRAARKSVPSTHIRCRITASLRATAMTARRWPPHLGQPHAPGLERRPGLGAGHEASARPCTAPCARSTSPAFGDAAGVVSFSGLIAPRRQPEVRGDVRDERKRLASSTPALKVSEVTGPTPGNCHQDRWQMGSWRTTLFTRRWSSLTRWCLVTAPCGRHRAAAAQTRR